MKLKLLPILLINFVVFAQNKPLLNNIKIDSNTKLIGMYVQYDKSKTYKYLNFYINNQKVIEDLAEKLTYGNVVENKLEQNNFRIIVLNGNEEVESWLVNPLFSNIIINGTYYKFDIKSIKELAEKYPFDYTFYEKSFTSINDYEKDLANVKKDKAFLFAYEPLLEYEGTFEIQFPKNSQFESPELIDDFLRPKVSAVAGDSEFNIFYTLDDYNKANTNQYTMTVQGNKSIFDKLVLENLTKKNWKKSEDSGMFFMKK